MLASDVISICGSPNGLSELCRMYQLSRRQGEAFERQARRLVASGHNPVLTPGSDAGTVRTAPKVTGDQEEPPSPSMEELAQNRARAINAQSYGQRSHDVGQLIGRISTLNKNVENGYGDAPTLHDLALSKRTLEILQGATFV